MHKNFRSTNETCIHILIEPGRETTLSQNSFVIQTFLPILLRLNVNVNILFLSRTKQSFHTYYQLPNF